MKGASNWEDESSDDQPELAYLGHLLQEDVLIEGVSWHLNRAHLRERERARERESERETEKERERERERDGWHLN